MNKKPTLLRTVIALLVIAVFAISMYPLTQRDFYETFQALLKDKKDPVAAELVAEAKALQAKDSALFASQALLAAADAKGVMLNEHVKGDKLEDNRDVMSLVRKASSGSIRLGLDLNGGVEFVLQLVPDQEMLKKYDGGKDSKAKAELQDQMDREFDRYRDIAIEILRKRLETQKIFEAEIAPSGSRYVSLKAPVVAKDEKLKLQELIAMSAKLQFRLVHPQNDDLVNAYLKDPAALRTPEGYELMSTTEFQKGDSPLKTYFFVEKRPLMDGKGIKDSYPTRDQFGQRRIILQFNQEGSRDFARVTTDYTGRALAVVLDGKLYCAPRINDPIIGGNAEITGQFSDEECKMIADALKSGSFPFQIKIDAVFDTDPKLGADNVANSIWVGLIGLLAVVVFMIAYYRVAGVVAVIALLINLMLMLGAMAAFDATLTLPGIAGIVLTLGMAVDANVLIFERIREELRGGKSLYTAIDLGYSRALSAVMDSNITTLITSLILMWVGTGAIKGFAVTLSIGILTTLFTALMLTRLIFDYMERSPRFRELHMMSLVSASRIPFNRLWHVLAPLSLAFILISCAVFLYKGQRILGIDFTGGTQITLGYVEQVPMAEIDRALADRGYEAVTTYKSGTIGGKENKLEILVRGDQKFDEASPMEAISKYLNERFPAAKFTGGEESSIGGLIGWEFSKAAMLAMVLATIGIGIYVSIRYEFSYAMASIIALLHDVLVVMGIYVMTGRTISLTVVAAILTVIGYSMNDKVVVFDRIRENVAMKSAASYLAVINMSLNQTLSRTILTSVTTLLVVVVMFIWGGAAINDFVFIMLLGIVVGTYSSLFIATPLVAMWHKRVGYLDHADHAAVAKKKTNTEA
jgi:SecD/SecF fusion protein